MTPDTASFREIYIQVLSKALELQGTVVSGKGAEEDLEVYYSIVERYCEEVDKLIELIKDPLFISVVSEQEHSTLTELLVDHESITTKLEVELGHVGHERAELQRKTRGISSYIDKLPKRISTLRTKKG